MSNRKRLPYCGILSLLLLSSCNKNDDLPENSTTGQTTADNTTYQHTVENILRILPAPGDTVYQEHTDDIHIRFAVDTTKTLPSPITFSKTTAGTATENEDYTLTANKTAFENSKDTIEVTLSVMNDTRYESSETTHLTFQFTQSSVTATQQLRFTIEDDDTCTGNNSLKTENIVCDVLPSETSNYAETVSADVRTIVTNNYPNHAFAEVNHTISQVPHTLTVDATPALAATNTSILRPSNQPRYSFGVALNGVLLSPSPAEPFIFTDLVSGEYNWDWVFEPTNNIGTGADWVSLDCNSAHINGRGEYHYHGLMYAYADTLLSGLGSGSTVPTAPVPVGWAADGFPIVYLYGPDGDGGLKKLLPSYQLKEGNRPGDGITAPCGPYNGKYTNDYEYVDGLGDLDACNGIARSITLHTAQGTETFSYFYVITEGFPQISRCFSGTPDNTFN